MSRRIEIEITSVKGDSATWRAAGAKLPKGALATTLVPGGPVVGTIYRAEIEQYMEGVEILSVLPAKEASPLDPRNERLAIIATPPKGPDVQVTYAPKGRQRGEREGARDGSRGPRSGGSSRKPREGAGVRTREPRAPREEGATSAPRESRPRTAGPRGPARPRGERTRPSGPIAPPIATIHRNAFLATLSPEQLPVAEQLLRGGMPAVRTAVAEQNKTAAEQGRPSINPEVIDRIAEELLGKANLSLWKDRAAGAVGAGKELRLRDLRAVVTSAKTVSLDDEARVQLKELQTSLNERVEALRTEWTAKLDVAVGANNVAEALRLTNRPPEHATRVSSEMATKIAAMASETLTAELESAKWIEIVNLAVEAPMRRLIKPTGIPSDEAARNLAVKSAGSIPELAKLLGIKVPPPPPPLRTPRRTPPTRRPS